jgi:hypothetical protein
MKIMALGVKHVGLANKTLIYANGLVFRLSFLFVCLLVCLFVCLLVGWLVGWLVGSH